MYTLRRSATRDHDISVPIYRFSFNLAWLSWSLVYKDRVLWYWSQKMVATLKFYCICSFFNYMQQRKAIHSIFSSIPWCCTGQNQSSCSMCLHRSHGGIGGLFKTVYPSKRLCADHILLNHWSATTSSFFDFFWSASTLFGTSCVWHSTCFQRLALSQILDELFIFCERASFQCQCKKLLCHT